VPARGAGASPGSGGGGLRVAAWGGELEFGSAQVFFSAGLNSSRSALAGKIKAVSLWPSTTRRHVSINERPLKPRELRALWRCRKMNICKSFLSFKCISRTGVTSFGGVLLCIIS
jgi:hypothetical protein